MKKLLLPLACLFGAALVSSAPAATVTGFVLNDVNHNSTFDSGDAGIANVQVIIVSQAGGFSNATVTAADGSFSLTIPNFDPLALRRDPLSQSYIETLNPATLPAGATNLFPQPITYLSLTPAYYIDFAADLTNVTFTSGTGPTPTGDWLINVPAGLAADCSLTGSGAISTKGRQKKIEHSFQGRITPAGGQWTDLAHQARLQFKTTQIQTSECGTIEGTAAGSNSVPFNVMDFTGLGTLKGIGGSKTNYGTVNFTARVEDHGKPGKKADRYYLRVYSSDGATLLLVSGDQTDALNVITVPISSGDLRLTHAP